MKYTLLEIVQSTLSSMDSDSVDSINETEEPEQIALVAQEVFYETIERDEWNNKDELISLDPVSNSNNPTAFLIPDNIGSIWFLKYDVAGLEDSYKQYKTLEYREPTEFLEFSLARRTDEDNVQVVEPDSNWLAELFIKNDQSPTYWTSFDDKQVLFDSFDQSVESWVQGSKLICMAQTIPTFELNDSYVIDLPSHMMPMYLAEVKSNCYFYFKQQINKKDEQKVLRNRSKLRRAQNRTGVDFYDKTARQDFGRRDPKAQNYPLRGRR